MILDFYPWVLVPKYIQSLVFLIALHLSPVPNGLITQGIWASDPGRVSGQLETYVARWAPGIHPRRLVQLHLGHPSPKIRSFFD
jgi:hypothetical protein